MAFENWHCSELDALISAARRAEKRARRKHAKKVAKAMRRGRSEPVYNPPVADLEVDVRACRLHALHLQWMHDAYVSIPVATVAKGFAIMAGIEMQTEEDGVEIGGLVPGN
eukprot:TRINITY_DN4577_c0_g1_i1.p1 TRINITY_DN4577_c0_g1~~TRINITY_DN4577_c0_g1_i1.p1  ORF type:complete len:111 (-),score=13.17 TRINITY_DN4577_c0_g1_i1:175-507(-)